jgi:hypothetical protein
MMYRVNADLQLGLEYNPFAGQVGPLANWRLLRETKTRPAVILGTSSDRIGTPDGQAYYATLSKDLRRSLKLPVAPYVGVLYSGFEDKIVYPFGVNVRFNDHWSALLSHDGRAFHPMLTYAWERFSLTVIAVRQKNLGLTFSIGY